MSADFRRLPVRVHHTVKAARQAALVLACCCGIFLGNLNAADPSAHNTLPPSVLSVDGGFTRETLMEFDAPEPAPFAPAPKVSVQESDEPTHSHVASRHRRQGKRLVQATKSPGTVVVAKAAPRRSPVVSFVYWWNGWVIRTFHTRVGTVMLDKIGAKT